MTDRPYRLGVSNLDNAIFYEVVEYVVENTRADEWCYDPDQDCLIFKDEEFRDEVYMRFM